MCVWQEMPAEVRATFARSLPRYPTPLDEVYRQVSENLMPYPMGNIHPRFWSWYMGSSNFTGALADFLALYQEGHALVADGDDAVVLQVGAVCVDIDKVRQDDRRAEGDRPEGG